MIKLYIQNMKEVLSAIRGVVFHADFADVVAKMAVIFTFVALTGFIFFWICRLLAWSLAWLFG